LVQISKWSAGGGWLETLEATILGLEALVLCPEGAREVSPGLKVETVENAESSGGSVESR
jgi:hypothetical protein